MRERGQILAADDFKLARFWKFDHRRERLANLRETLVEATAKAADAAELFLTAPIEELMKRFNAAPKSEAVDGNGGVSAERGTE